ncbi:MerR family transcriptional regulator [Lactococcus garvieae]|jgi:DNA-binding transcriptional MerR regulator|uniref:MerR family transcriptional regulator n=1 Tax=Lactococcus garvieae TaxID=1363 RepID=A0AAX3NCC3_9LACT|nr:MerR family transcriptional regulator [Lactococcus garvieae]NHI69946.1 MerR family transcriptional regulator [Lactococcus garvieae]NHJ07854.1 MerR family transcriptional regulator [Lactococcus garvieae]WEA14055.1 MerR family transcriptional regulator [Lactococcus garvieae]
MYTIGEVSKMFNIPISTLRYYDKEGLFPKIERKSGIRQFSEEEIEAIRVFDCLKKSGLKIKDIKHFIEWTQVGNETLQVRKELFDKQKIQIQSEIENLKKTLDMINYKCWYYNEALKAGDESSVITKIPNDLPQDIKECYFNSHS